MISRILILGMAILCFVSCHTNTKIADGEKNYGKVIDETNAITYDDLLAKLETKDSIFNVKVVGKVDAVCQKKGCWMTIVSEAKNKEEMFVKFKDYAFFMPLDLGGNEVVMHGNAYREITSVEELQHYAEDDGQSKEEIAKITEPKVELKFMAEGVFLK